MRAGPLPARFRIDPTLEALPKGPRTLIPAPIGDGKVALPAAPRHIAAVEASMRTGFLLFLIACGSSKATVDTATVEETDADTDADSDADTDADSDADSDADTDADADADLTILLSGDTTGLRLTLPRVDPALVTGGDFSLVPDSDLGGAAPTGASVDLVVGAPPAEDLVDGGGFLLAFYAPLLFEDDDGDERYDEGEVIRGLTNTWALYLDGAVPADMATMGFEPGWNAITLEIGGGSAFWADPLAIPLPVNLPTIETLDLAGDWTEAVSEDARIAILAQALFEGAPASPLDDTSLSSAWELGTTGRPPAAHFVPIDGLADEAAIEYVVAYTDGDRSGGISAGDSALSTACVDGHPLTIAYFPEATDGQAALGYFALGVTPGWNALYDAGTGPLVADADALRNLHAGSDCPFGG